MFKKKQTPRRLGGEKTVKNIQFLALSIPTILILIAFSYIPMFGLVLPFKNYKVTDGIWGSDWASPLFKNFEFFFKSKNAGRVIRNTLGLNILFIVTSTVCAVAFALLMFEVKKPHHVKLYQTFAILPSFLSWVAVSYIVYGLLETDKGILNKLIISLGGSKINWYNKPGLWPAILAFVSIWHDVGLSSIIYYAALMGIDNSLFEAAEMDGAKKWGKIWNVSIPQLVPIITMMTILKIGGIFRSDFGLFYNVTRNVGVLYPTTDVMDTFVYRALLDSGNIGMSSAASFIQSIVCFVTITLANTVVKKIDKEKALF